MIFTALFGAPLFPRFQFRRTSMSAKKRLNLAIPERALDRLDWLQKKTDAASHTEVIRQALFVYEQLVSRLSEGSTLMEKTTGGILFQLPISIDVKASPKPELKVAS
jgi:hypothetical protein